MMERQAGLGRSLEDVLDSLAPADPDATAAGRVLFEPEDLEQQLDQLMGDLRDLRERVQHLVGLVPDEAVVGATNGHAPTGAGAHPDDDPKAAKKKKKKKKKKSKKKSTK